MAHVNRKEHIASFTNETKARHAWVKHFAHNHRPT